MLANSFFRLVTLKIPGISGGNTGTNFFFPDIGDLRYARILALETYFASALVQAFPENVPVVNDIFAPKISFIFSSNDPDKTEEQQGKDGRFNTTIDSVRCMPAVSLNRTQSFGVAPAPFVRQLMLFKDLYIVWDKSSVVISGSGLGNTTDVAIVLGVYYTFINVKGQQYKRT